MAGTRRRRRRLVGHRPRSTARRARLLVGSARPSLLAGARRVGRLSLLAALPASHRTAQAAAVGGVPTRLDRHRHRLHPVAGAAPMVGAGSPSRHPRTHLRQCPPIARGGRGGAPPGRLARAPLHQDHARGGWASGAARPALARRSGHRRRPAGRIGIAHAGRLGGLLRLPRPPRWRHRGGTGATAGAGGATAIGCRHGALGRMARTALGGGLRGPLRAAHALGADRLRHPLCPAPPSRAATDPSRSGIRTSAPNAPAPQPYCCRSGCPRGPPSPRQGCSCCCPA